jgi:hypothetical protein
VKREPNCLYEVEIESLQLNFVDSAPLDVTETLENGRSSYVLFQLLVSRFAGLLSGGEGAGSDLVGADGLRYEVKSYRDPELHPEGRYDWFHTAASSTFGPNKLGPEIGKLLKDGNYSDALKICKTTGYDHNDFYIYTNTGGYRPEIPFRYMVIPKAQVLSVLSPEDPREVSRRVMLDSCDGRTERLSL